MQVKKKDNYKKQYYDCTNNVSHIYINKTDFNQQLLGFFVSLSCRRLMFRDECVW